MANPVLKKDIIENGLDTLLEKVNDEFDRMVGNLTTLRSGYVQTAQTIGQNVTANSNNAESLSKEAAALSAVEEGIKKVDSTTRMLTEDKKRLNEEARKYKKLTDDEKESVKKLSSDLEYYVRLMHSSSEVNQKLGQLYAKNIAEIDIQKKSYNELYQTYNAINEALKKMTTEERLSSDAGKAMTAQAYKIRDTLNELQKSTGNYTLQVGKYRAAFDGLGYSFQQILREAPSALNLNQFFLAISNNIPQFLDQLKAFQDEQKEIKANLDTMTKGTKEYNEQAAKQISLGKKIKGAIFSWQTAIIAVLFAIRQIDFDKIWKGFKKLITVTKEWWNEVIAVQRELNKIENTVTASIEPVRKELQYLINDLEKAKVGSNDWYLILMRIEEITGKNLTNTVDTVDAVKEVTDAYIEQLKQIETNKAVIERFGALNKRKYALENIFNPAQDDSLLSWITGLNDDDKKEVEEALEAYRKFMDDVTKENYEVTDVISGMYDRLIKKYGKDKKESINKVITKRLLEKANGGDFGSKEIIETLGGWGKDEEASLHYIIKSILEKDGDIKEGVKIVARELVRTKKTIDATDNLFNELYKGIPNSTSENNSSGNSSSASFNNSYRPPTMGEILVAEANAMKEKGDTVLNEIKLWYEKRVAIANASYKKEKEDIKRDKEEKEKSLRENVLNAQKFIASYNKVVSGLDKEHAVGRLNDEEWKAQKNKLAHQYSEASKLLKKAVKNGKINESEEWMTIQRWASARENAAMLEHQNQLTDLVQQEQEKRAKVYVDGAKREAKAVESQFKHSGTLEEMEQYAAQMQEVINKLVEMSKAEEYGETAMNVFTDGLANMNNQLETMNENIDKKKLSDIEQHYKELTKVVHNRVKTINDEKLKNEDLTHNIDILKQKLKELTDEQMRSGKGDEKKAQDIEKVRQAIERLQQQISHTKQLANYTDLGDIFKRNVNVGSGTQRKIMEAILGKDAYKAFEGDDEALKNAIAKDFDEWADNAMSAVSTWYSTTMGYINDLISAYVELANAKAEAAAEATEAAQEEYDKEKALLEAGYASRVEATWAEYQEKKAAQEKAEADAKAAAQAQKQLNEVETAGSMIVAAANIWKTFSGMGPVGIALAAVATAGMFAAFIASKAKAAEVSKYGEGDVQLVGGGSHASGHDTLLGYSLQGKEMRVENGEVVGIVPRRSVRRIGEQNVLNTMRALRDGTFEANTIKRIGIERNVGMSVLSAPRTDLHRVESDLHKLVSYGSRSRTVNADGSVTEIRKNAKIVYKNG